MNRLLFVGVLTLAATVPVWAQNTPLTYTISAKPALPASPALRYSLLPDLKDMYPGNALTRYYKAFSPEWWGTIQRQNLAWHEGADKAMVTALDKLPAEYAFVKSWKMLLEVDRGARLDHCDWELLPRLRDEGFATLLPDVQSMRNIGRFLALRARYELADGNIDKAIYSIQTGLALSKHLGEGPSLIHMLVGVAISQIVVKQLDEVLAHPKAPNLYWALARMPHPYIDIRRPVQGEALMTSTVFPEYEEIRHAPIPLDQAQKLMDDFVQRCRNWGVANVAPGEVAMTALAVYPKAKASLIRRGRPMGQVEAMPVPQVLLLNTAEEMFRLRDDMFKWMTLPYHEALAGITKAETEVRASQERGDTLPMATEFLPAVQKTLNANVRIERRFNMLRVIEALRWHAAVNDGRLPARLSDITVAPIPSDPFSGKAFTYQRTEDGATITGETPEGGPPFWGMIYHLKLKK